MYTGCTKLECGPSGYIQYKHLSSPLAYRIIKKRDAHTDCSNKYVTHNRKIQCIQVILIRDLFTLFKLMTHTFKFFYRKYRFNSQFLGKYGVLMLPGSRKIISRSMNSAELIMILIRHIYHMTVDGSCVLIRRCFTHAKFI